MPDGARDTGAPHVGRVRPAGLGVAGLGVRLGRWRGLVAVLPAALAVGLLFAGGLLGAIRSSLGVTAASGWGAADLDAYRTLFDDPAFLDAVWFTLRIAAISTVVSAVLALLAAGALRHRGALLRSLSALPVPIPHLIVAVIAVLWLGPGGVAERLLGGLPWDLVRDPAGVGVILVYIYKETPFLALLLLAAWTPALEARAEAAAVLGANPWQRLRWVIWPAIRGPLLTGSIIVAAFVLGAFEVPLAIGPTYPLTLPELALEATKTAELGGRSIANAALVLTALATIVLAIAAGRGLRSEDA